MSNNICLIPARAGSKRVPKKNILKLNNKPLIKYTIDFAQQICKSKDIYVSSDSEQILELSKNSGVNIHKRPVNMSQDNTSMIETTLDFIKNKRISYQKNLILLQPTTPFRDKDFFYKLIKTFNNHPESTSAISLIKCSFFHPSKIGYLVDNNFNKLNVEIEDNIDNDKKKPYYVISGSYYIVNINKLIKQQSFIGSSPVGLEEPIKTFCNIDNPLDFKIAEFIGQEYNI